MRLSLVALLVRDYDEAVDRYGRALDFLLTNDEDQGCGNCRDLIEPNSG